MIPVQFITNATERFTHEQGAAAALEGGCKWIQLRMKDCPEGSVKKKEIALSVADMCKEHRAILIIDDDVDLAMEIQADGVHLGKKDMPVAEARRILGEGMIIGATANTYDDILLAKQAGADYIGLGPFRFTTTKKGLSPILGLDGYESIIKKLHESSINVPIVAIGGITRTDVPQLLRTGVNGVAVSGAILRADNATKEMESFLNITTD